jgi:hypothetical protein
MQGGLNAMYSLTVRLLMLCHYTEYQAQCIAPFLCGLLVIFIVAAIVAALVPDEAPPAVLGHVFTFSLSGSGTPSRSICAVTASMIYTCSDFPEAAAAARTAAPLAFSGRIVMLSLLVLYL